MSPLLLRTALSANLGRVLTPEVAAHIESIALYNPMPLPHTGDSPRLSNVQYEGHVRTVNERIGCDIDPSCARVLVGYDSSGTRRCVVTFHNLRRDSVDVTVISDGSGHWLTRDMLRAAWRYPFEQLNVSRCTAYARADNERSIALCEHVGFVREGLMRHEDHDVVVMGALRSECRWIKGKH